MKKTTAQKSEALEDLLLQIKTKIPFRLWREANGRGPDTSASSRVRALELLMKHFELISSMQMTLKKMNPDNFSLDLLSANELETFEKLIAKMSKVEFLEDNSLSYSTEQEYLDGEEK